MPHDFDDFMARFEQTPPRKMPFFLTVVVFLLFCGEVQAADAVSNNEKIELQIACAAIGAIGCLVAYVRFPSLHTKEGPVAALGIGATVGFFVPGLIVILCIGGFIFLMHKLMPSIEVMGQHLKQRIDEFEHHQRHSADELKLKQQATDALLRIAQSNDGTKRKKKRRPKPATAADETPEQRLARMEEQIKQARREAKEHGYSQDALNEQIAWIRRMFS